MKHVAWENWNYLEQIANLKQRNETLEANVQEVKDDLEKLRLRLSGPAKEEKPVVSKHGDWRAQRRDLEAKNARPKAEAKQ